MESSAEPVVMTSRIYPCKTAAHVSNIKNTLLDAIQSAGMTKPWLLRDSKQGLGFLTLEFMIKVIHHGKRKVIQSQARFYFDEVTHGWSVCPGGDYLEQKHAVLKAIRKDPDASRYERYLDALNREESMNKLFKLIEDSHFNPAENQKYTLVVQPEEARNLEYAFMSNLSKKLEQYVKTSETVLTNASSGLFHHDVAQPADREPLLRSKSPDGNVKS